jgi:hypothetical protein
MSDTRAAIRELRSLSEKRGTQGLSEAERERFATLRQRLGLPPEPEQGTAAAPPGAGRDAGAASPPQQGTVEVAAPSLTLSGRGPAGASDTTTRARDTDRFATVRPDEISTFNGATTHAPSTEPAEEGLPGPPEPAAPVNLAWTAQEGAQPIQLAEVAPPEASAPEPGAPESLDWTAQEGAQPIQLSEVAPPEAPTPEPGAPESLDWAAEDGAQPFQLSEVAATQEPGAPETLAWTAQEAAQPLEFSEVAPPEQAAPVGLVWRAQDGGQPFHLSEVTGAPEPDTQDGAQAIQLSEVAAAPEPGAPESLDWAAQDGAQPLEFSEVAPREPAAPVDPAWTAQGAQPLHFTGVAPTSEPGAPVDLAWAAQDNTQPLHFSDMAAALEPGTPDGLDWTAERGAQPLHFSDMAAALEPGTPDGLDWTAERGAQPLHFTDVAAAPEPGTPEALDWTAPDGSQPLHFTDVTAAPEPGTPEGLDWTAQQSAEAVAATPPEPPAWQSSDSGDAGARGAQPTPPDALIPGERRADFAAGAVAEAALEGPTLVLNPEDLGATPLDDEAFVPEQVEGDGELPFGQATRPYPIDARFNPAWWLGADEPIAPPQDSGPIELSAADVMLVEEGEGDVRADRLGGLDLGGDASEPLPLAEAHDFVQYQRQDGLAVPLEESGPDEFLQGAEALQASTAELATSPQAYVRPPAAPGIRVPPPPSSGTALPRAASAPTMPVPRAAPMAAPAATAPPPATAAPVARSMPSVPLGPTEPPPAPPSLRPAPRPVPTPPTPAGFPPPPPLRLPRPPPASLMHPPGATQPPAPLKAPTPPFPRLTPTLPDPPEGPAPQSGPFAPPTLLPAAPLDVMDGFEQEGLPGAQPFSPPPPPPTAAVLPQVASEASVGEPVFGSSFLSPTFVEGEHRVVVHTLEGQVKRGTVSDVDLLDAMIRLNQPGLAQERIATERLKAIFFMQAPGEPPLPHSGRKVRVHFRDGRQLLGFSEDVESSETGFFLIPADTRTHTARIYVFRVGVQSISNG